MFETHKKAAGPILAFSFCLILSIVFCFIIVRPHAESVECVGRLETDGPALSEADSNTQVLRAGNPITQELPFKGSFEDVQLYAVLSESIDEGAVICTIIDASNDMVLATAKNEKAQTADYGGLWFPLDSPVQASGDSYYLEFALAAEAGLDSHTAEITLPLSGLRSPYATMDSVPLSGSLNLSVFAKASFLYGYFWLIALILCVLAALSWHLLFNRKVKPQTLFLVLALGIGVLHMGVSTPYGNEVFDEYRFTKTIQYHSSVLMGAEHKDTTSGSVWQNRSIDDLRGFQVPPDTSTYYHAWSNLFDLAPPQTTTVETSAHLYGFEYEFIAPIIGTTIGRLLGLGQVPTLYLAKLLNLVLYVSLLYLAIRIAPKRLQTLFLLVGLIPLSLYYAGTQSYDAFINALCPLFISYVLHLADNETGKDTKPGHQVGLRQMATLAILGILIAPLKVIYLPLLLLPLIIPAQKWRWRHARLLFLIVLFALGLAAIGFLNSRSLASFAAASSASGADYGYTDALANKTEFARLYLTSLINGPEKIWQSTVYIWSAPGSGYVGYLALVLIGLGVCSYRDTEGPVFTVNQKLVAAVATLGVFLLTFIAAYTWTPIGAYEIYGVHGRYFIPTLPLLAILATSLIARRRIADNTLIVAMFLINTYCIFNVVQVALFQ